MLSFGQLVFHTHSRANCSFYNYLFIFFHPYLGLNLDRCYTWIDVTAMQISQKYKKKTIIIIRADGHVILGLSHKLNKSTNWLKRIEIVAQKKLRSKMGHINIKKGPTNDPKVENNRVGIWTPFGVSNVLKTLREMQTEPENCNGAGILMDLPKAPTWSAFW